MPPRPAGRGGGDPLTPDDLIQVVFQMAQSSQQLTLAVASLATSQASFMRSAADADVNIGLSKSQPLLDSEIASAKVIDNTVDDDHRNGLPAFERDTTPRVPPDLVTDIHADDYDVTDYRHGLDYGAGHHEATPERADALNAFHRERGRNIRMLEKQLPADGYMNTFKDPAQQQSQWGGCSQTFNLLYVENQRLQISLLIHRL